jgi:uridine kinase
VRARVIVLAGPSGAGKSRLAERIGLPVLRLDDFYRSAGDPALPLLTKGAPSIRLVPRLLRTRRGSLVDWDDPRSWHADDALTAVAELCREGRATVPIYDIARDGRCGTQTLDLGDSELFVAEGIFAQEIVPGTRAAGLLAAAYCIRQHPLVTFWRRLTRDLREHRKPPLVLARRGVALLRAQREVVAHAVALGCEPVTPDQALSQVRDLVTRGIPR